MCRSGCRPNEALKITQSKLHHPDEPEDSKLECAAWKKDKDGWVASISGEFTKTGYRYQWRFISKDGKKLAKQLVELHQQDKLQNRPEGMSSWSYYGLLSYFRCCCK